MKKVLITGISGFMGNSLKNFIERSLPSYEVYGIDISLSRPTGRYFRGDINNRKFLRKIIKKIGPQYIFHLAGLTKAKDLSRLITANTLTTHSLLDSMLALKNLKARIIIPGTAAEYGRVSQKDMPVKETHPLRPVNPYGFSKACQTLLALNYSKKGLNIVIGRVFNVSGWGTPD
ncbi:unnamed protein product, partial [marine sediment metagenome]